MNPCKAVDEMDQERQNTICGYIARYMLGQVGTLEREVGGALAGGGAETVHRIRIATRRLRISLKLFNACIPGESLTGWQDDVGRTARILGNLRDLDIQIDFLGQVVESPLGIRFKPGYRRLLLRLNQKRDRVRNKAFSALQRLQGEGVLSGMRAQLETIASDEGEVYHPAPVIFEQAGILIGQALDDFLAYQPYVRSPDNADMLHAMRIAGKNLRYTMEVFAPIYGHALQPHLQVMQELQEELGEFHDNDVWVTWLPKFIEKEQLRIRDYYGDDRPIRQLLPGLNHLIEDRREARQETHRTFLSTWDILEGENAWQLLLDILKSHIIDVTSQEEKDAGDKTSSGTTDQSGVQEHTEFEIELSPDEPGGKAENTDQENSLEEA